MNAHKRPTNLEVIEGGSLQGPVDPFGLVDYLQMAGFGKYSVTVCVYGQNVSGEITIRDGEIWAAKDQHGAGEEAFRRLVKSALSHAAPVRCRPVRKGVVGRNVQSSLEGTLLEVARQWDEGKSADRDEPQVDENCSSQEHFEALFDEGVDALLRKDYAEAYSAFRTAADIRPDDRMVLANLERLAALGVGEDGDGTGE